MQTELDLEKLRALVDLRFVNSDAKPKVTTIRCDTASIAPIMAWYGAYYAGDRYAVFADDQKLEKDHNGEWKHSHALRKDKP